MRTRGTSTTPRIIQIHPSFKSNLQSILNLIFETYFCYSLKIIFCSNLRHNFPFPLIQYFAFSLSGKQFVRPYLQLHASTCFTTANPSTTHKDSTWHEPITKISSNSHKITIFCSLSSSRKLEYFMEFQIYKNLPPPQQ